MRISKVMHNAFYVPVCNVYVRVHIYPLAKLVKEFNFFDTPHHHLPISSAGSADGDGLLW